MPTLSDSPAWRALAQHQREIEHIHMRDLFAQDPERFERFSLRFESLLLDYSKNRITTETMRLLLDLATQADLSDWIVRMFDGEKINATENRAVLHIALRNRSNRPIRVDGQDVMPEVNAVLEHMRRFSQAVRSGTWRGYRGQHITDVVNIGIGGSDLGPVMVTEALKPYAQEGLHVHFVSNIDSTPCTAFPPTCNRATWRVMAKASPGMECRSRYPPARSSGGNPAPMDSTRFTN